MLLPDPMEIDPMIPEFIQPKRSTPTIAGFYVDADVAAGLPVAFVLAGGYTGQGLDEAELVDLHRLTLEAAVRHA